MANRQELAIIIPAYKSRFLKETLDSIANQTCNDFVLYIGDDASPHNLKDIIFSYEHKLNIVYQRFDNNLGNSDLIAHWNRCISMVKDEKWFWLFSDDDLMAPNCVESFYDFINKNRSEIILHFNVQIIDENNKHIKKTNYFPETLSTTNFFRQRINWKIDSFVIEYVFNRIAFENVGRFEIFDLGWCSDDATWIKLSSIREIKTISEAKVKWRLSKINISSITEDKAVIIRKLIANCQFVQWATFFFKQNNILDATSKIEKAKWAFIGIFSTSSMTFSEKNYLSEKYLKILGYKRIRIPIKLYLFYFHIKTYLKLSQ
jgi:glycosyltransferase involved in cell wall biosynthesis